MVQFQFEMLSGIPSWLGHCSCPAEPGQVEMKIAASTIRHVGGPGKFYNVPFVAVKSAAWSIASTNTDLIAATFGGVRKRAEVFAQENQVSDEYVTSGDLEHQFVSSCPIEPGPYAAMAETFQYLKQSGHWSVKVFGAIGADVGLRPGLPVAQEADVAEPLSSTWTFCSRICFTSVPHFYQPPFTEQFTPLQLTRAAVSQ